MRRLKCLCIGALARARCRVRFGEFAAEDDGAAVAERHPALGAGLIACAVAFIILRILSESVHSGLIVENDVDHAGDRVRAILRRCPVAQHLDALDCKIGNGRKIGGLRTARPEQRGAVIAFAVHQHEGLVGGQAAQRRRAHECEPVGRGQPLNIEGGEQLRERVGEVIGHAAVDRLRREDVDRRQRIELGAPRVAGSGHDDGITVVRRLDIGGNGFFGEGYRRRSKLQRDKRAGGEAFHGCSLGTRGREVCDPVRGPSRNSI